MLDLHTLTLLAQGVDIHLVDVADIAIHQLRFARDGTLVGHLMTSLDIFLKSMIQFRCRADGVCIGGVVLSHHRRKFGSCLKQFIPEAVKA